jgi:transposase
MTSLTDLREVVDVVIGVDTHVHTHFLATGRFGTDKTGYSAMRKHVASYPDRVWAVEGSNGAGRPLAQRLLADGELVVDVPAKLSARARLLDTGHNRKTDAHDAHAVTVVAVRTTGLRVLAYDVELEALRMLADRRDELSKSRFQAANRLHRLLAELVPGQGKKNITTGQAKTILASVRPRDVAGKTRRRLAAEQITELVAVEKKIKNLTKELKEMVIASGSTLMELPGVGPVVPRGPWPTPGTSPASPTATGSRPGPAPPPSKPPAARSSDTASPGPGTAG